jgi:ubiquinone/menaquinone biosynthesis C-methylase UbiE
MEDTYTHGHQEPVLRSHRWRTAENSAGYLLRELWPGMQLLDVGCGPGTITVDLARLVSPGLVVGIDHSSEAVDEARKQATDELGAVDFQTGNVYELDFEDESFDVVHAHQVLQHLSDPVRALIEMRRVLRPGGILAVRDSDYAGFIWAPEDRRMDRWLELYHHVSSRNRAEADAGRHLPAWVRMAGFSNLKVTSSVWSFADSDSRAWWGGLWADRVTGSSFATHALNHGLTSPEELQDLADGWRTWASHEDAVFVVPHVEVLAWR